MRLHMQSFRVTETEAQAIKQHAEREHMSASELLRQALAAYLTPPAPPKSRRAKGRAQAALAPTHETAPIQP